MSTQTRSNLFHITLVAALALLGATAACGPADQEGEPGSEEAPTTDTVDAAGSSEAETAGGAWLREVRIGDSLDPEGAVPADAAAERFAPGDSIFVSVGVENAPASAAVHTVFYDSSGEKVAEDEKKVPADARYLYFDAGDTSNWLPGDYRVELVVDGEVRSTEEITLAEGGAGGETEAGASE